MVQPQRGRVVIVLERKARRYWRVSRLIVSGKVCAVVVRRAAELRCQGRELTGCSDMAPSNVALIVSELEEPCVFHE